MRTVFPLRAPSTIPVVGSALLFPVRRIYCVGQNYESHQKEMGNTTKAPPFFFMKPSDAVVPPGTVPYPSMTKSFHFEVELVIAMGCGPSRDMSPADALAAVFGYAVGIDFTRRDLQAAAKAAGRPWEMGKSFDASASMSAITSAASWSVGTQSIELKVNGVVKQKAVLNDMIWDVPHIIAELSRFVTLEAGDLIMTGTPAGVGAVVVGDVIDASIEGIEALKVVVGAPLGSSRL